MQETRQLLAIVLVFVVIPSMVQPKLVQLSEQEMRAVTGQAGLVVPGVNKNLQNQLLPDNEGEIRGVNRLTKDLPVPRAIRQSFGKSVARAAIENPREFRRIMTSDVTRELLKISQQFARIIGNFVQVRGKKK